VEEGRQGSGYLLVMAVYKGELPNTTLVRLLDIYRLADMFLATKVRRQCERFFNDLDITTTVPREAAAARALMPRTLRNGVPMMTFRRVCEVSAVRVFWSIRNCSLFCPHVDWCRDLILVVLTLGFSQVYVVTGVFIAAARWRTLTLICGVSCGACGD
jgi:hypothetical protein